MMQLTAEKVGELVAAGRYWWFRDCVIFATNDAEPDQEGDLYLLDASSAWVEQWSGDWQAAADQLNPFMHRIPGIDQCDAPTTP